MSSIPVMQSVESAPGRMDTAREPIAPWWHTLLILAHAAVRDLTAQQL